MRGLPTLLLVVVIVAFWQCLNWVIGSGAITSPAQTLVHLAQMLSGPTIWVHITATAEAFIYSFLIALIAGMLLGLLLGINQLTGNVAEPILMNLYAIPKVTLYPLVLLCFGLGMASKVAFGVMHGLIPIMLFTMNAIRQIPGVYMRASQSMRLTRVQTAFYIIAPAIIPEVLAGIRLGFALTLLGVLIGEMFASQKGLGYLAVNAMGVGDIATILAIAVLLTLFAVACNGFMLFVHRRLKHA